MKASEVCRRTLENKYNTSDMSGISLWKSSKQICATKKNILLFNSLKRNRGRQNCKYNQNQLDSELTHTISMGLHDGDSIMLW